MAAITAQLKLEINQFRNAVKNVKQATSDLRRHSARSGAGIAQGLFGGLASAARRAANSVMGPIKKLGAGMGVAMGFQLTQALGGAIKGAFGGVLQAGMEKENLTIAFDALSVDKSGGERIFSQLRDDSLKTGAAIGEMAKNVRKFMAQGMDEAQALKLNKALLDIGGATGLTGAEIGLLGNALSQVKGKGVAMMEELRGQIAEKGVPIFEALRQSMNFETTQDLFKSVQKGKVSAEDVISVFRDMKGPFADFKGGAERVGSTLAGMFGRLKNEVIEFKRIIGTELIPVIKPHIDKAIERMKVLRSTVADMIGLIKDGFAQLGTGGMMNLVKDGLQIAFKTAVNTLHAGLMGVVGAVGAAFVENIKNQIAMFQVLTSADFWSGLKSGLQAAARSFADIMYEVIANVLRGLKDIPIIGGKLGGAAANIDANRSANRAAQDKEISNSELVKSRIAGTIKGIGKGFADGFKNSKGIFDKDQLAEDLQDLRGRIKDITRSEQDAPLKPAPKPGPDPGAGPSTTTNATPAQAITPQFIVSSMAKIGGGGRVAAQQNRTRIAQQQLQVQKKMETHLRKAAANKPAAILS